MSDYMDGWKGRKPKDGFWSAQRKRGDDDRRAHQKRMAAPADFGKRNSPKRQVNRTEDTWQPRESGSGLFTGFKAKPVAPKYTPSRQSSPSKDEKSSWVPLLVVLGIIFMFFASYHNKPSPPTKATAAIKTAPEYTDGPIAPAKTTQSIPIVREEPLPEVHGVPNSASLTVFAHPDPTASPSLETPKQHQDVPITPVVPEREILAAAPKFEPDIKQTQSSNGMVFAANREDAANGCKNGELVMGISTMSFSCPSTPARGMSVNIDQVKAVYDDGIETYSGTEYHFEISGRSKQEAALLFRQWFSGARF